MFNRAWCFAACVAALLLGGRAAEAHDPSAYGGLFRSRDFGQTWLNADAGLFLGGAVALAIDPTDPNHLLLGTTTNLLVSANGGRTWNKEAPAKLSGAVFAVSFLPDGRSALCVTPAGVFRSENGAWLQADAPAEAAPARAIVPGVEAKQIYLIGRRDLFRSDDGGHRWSRVEHAMEEQPEFTELLVAGDGRETLYAIVGGRVMASADRGHRWQRRDAGLPQKALEALTLDRAGPARLWVAGGDQLYLSEDAGAHWKAVGAPLPEPGTSVRGIAADAERKTIVLMTHRGLLRSTDGARTWNMLEGNLPVHLEGRPLLRDASSANTLYAGFALMPYGELWRMAVEGGNLLNQLDLTSLAGGAAFLLLLVIAGIVLARRLARTSLSNDTSK